MRYFFWLDFQFIAMAFFLGLTAFALTWIAWGTYPLRRRPETEKELEKLVGHEIESGHDVEKTPIAPFIIFVYVLIVLWSLGYMIFVGIRGGTI